MWLSDRRSIFPLSARSYPDYDFSNVRVIQRNLVYITNLPESLSSERTLRSVHYFGQYGGIQKCIINKSKLSTPRKPTYNAYITYSASEEAALCIQACNLFTLSGNVLEATLGTTRYCTHFLSQVNCPRTDCLFLHQRHPDAEIVLKDAYTQSRRMLYIDHSLNNDTQQEGGGTAARQMNEDEIDLDCEPDSPCLAKRTKSRFVFASEEGEGREVDGLVRGLVLAHSPSRSVAHMSSEQYEELLSPRGKDPWASDVIYAIPVRKSFDVVKYGQHDDVYLVSRSSKESII